MRSAERGSGPRAPFAARRCLNATLGAYDGTPSSVALGVSFSPREKETRATETPTRRLSMDNDRNLLGDETSPYLLQHADNPVHWRPWGAEALAEAETRLSDPAVDRLRRLPLVPRDGARVVREPETAARMNELFVNIKVDREERPDIDHLYMSALHALGQQGGWPLTMFLDPDGRPIYGGTYWPPEPRWGRPSFRQILESMRRRLAHATGKNGGERRGARGSSRPAFGAEPRPRARSRRRDSGRGRTSPRHRPGPWRDRRRA